jgi:hypothetical protein
MSSVMPFCFFCQEGLKIRIKQNLKQKTKQTFVIYIMVELGDNFAQLFGQQII